MSDRKKDKGTRIRVDEDTFDERYRLVFNSICNMRSGTSQQKGYTDAELLCKAIYLLSASYIGESATNAKLEQYGKALGYDHKQAIASHEYDAKIYEI